MSDMPFRIYGENYCCVDKSGTTDLFYIWISTIKKYLMLDWCTNYHKMKKMKSEKNGVSYE